MAVSAETNATVIKTKARSSRRKNFRIAGDYRPVKERLLRGWAFLTDRRAVVFPLGAACVAGPTVHLRRGRNTRGSRHISDRFIELFIGNIERMAVGTLWLRDDSHAFHV